MTEDKQHRALKSSRQRAVLDKLMTKLAKKEPSFYYLSTSDIAASLHEAIVARAGLSPEDFELVKDLERQDIQILLSIHHH